MFKPTRRGFLQALLAAPAAVAARPVPAKDLAIKVVVSNQAAFFASLNNHSEPIGDYMPSYFRVPQNPCMDHGLVVGLHARGIQ